MKPSNGDWEEISKNGEKGLVVHCCTKKNSETSHEVPFKILGKNKQHHVEFEES